MLRQRQEEMLHQRERELTALKGALKEEVECHDREMETLRDQYRQDMENLRRTMEQVTQVCNDSFRNTVNGAAADMGVNVFSLQSQFYHFLPLRQSFCVSKSCL